MDRTKVDVTDQICLACPSDQNMKCNTCKRYICKNCLIDASDKNVYCPKCFNMNSLTRSFN